MSKISLSDLRDVLADFFDQRVLPAMEANPASKWMLAGAMSIFLSNLEKEIEKRQILKDFDIVDDNMNINAESAAAFLNAAFTKQSVLPIEIFGTTIKFDKDDGAYMVSKLREKAKEYGQNVD